MVLLVGAREEDQVHRPGEVLELGVGHQLALLGHHPADLPDEAADADLLALDLGGDLQRLGVGQPGEVKGYPLQRVVAQVEAEQVLLQLELGVRIQRCDELLSRMLDLQVPEEALLTDQLVPSRALGALPSLVEFVQEPSTLAEAVTGARFKQGLRGSLIGLWQRGPTLQGLVLAGEWTTSITFQDQCFTSRDADVLDRTQAEADGLAGDREVDA